MYKKLTGNGENDIDILRFSIQLLQVFKVFDNYRN